MPHSVSPESPHAEDSVLPDAPQPVKDEEMQDSDDLPMGDADMNESEPKTTQDADKNDNETEEKKDLVNLEDMFDDSDEDEYLMSSAAAPQTQIKAEDPISSSPPPLPKPAPNSGFSDPSIMKAFYQRLFPFRPLFQWLNHSPTPQLDFMHREFAFTLPNDAYLRYQSFKTSDQLRKQCIDMLPSRFEIGPIYSTDPKERKTLRKASAFKPLRKELVFDIDMTDYDGVRTCCSGAKICHKCWGFITMAIKVVDIALREDFGFKHILWVYSGRRGAHAWVCDKRAREMDDQKRRAVAGYLELVRGGDQSGKKVNIKRNLKGKLPPHLHRSLDILKETFSGNILEDQDTWASDEKASHLLSLIPDTNLRAALQKKWDSAPGRSSASKWTDIDTVAKLGVSKNLDRDALLEAKQDIVLEYTYPRLDAEVSKKLNHLLKSPFVVHPGTGRICVPIDARRAEEFDPLSVPTVTQCLGEIDGWNGEEGEEKKIQDWEKTSLKPYVDYFRGFVASLLKDERGGKRVRDESEGMEF